MKYSNLIVVGLLVVGAGSSAPAASYTGKLDAIPAIESIDKTFSPATVQVSKKPVKKKEVVLQPSIKYKETYLMLRDGKLNSRENIDVFKDDFNRIIVIIKQDGKYRYDVTGSMSRNGQLVFKSKGNDFRNLGTMKFKKDDRLMFRNMKINLNLYRME